ncbi:MAG: M23 family metallopeptidase [Gemmatimonadota bacterium]
MKKPAHWTVQFFPAGGGRVHTVRLGRRVAQAAAAGAGLSLLLFLGWLFGLLGERHALGELAHLRAENRHLIGSLKEAEGRTERLSLYMDRLAARDQQYRVLAGLPLLDPEVQAVGVGGPESPDVNEAELYRLRPELATSSQSLRLDLDALLRRADLLSASLREATDSMISQRELFQARPSINPVVSSEAWFSSGFSYSRLHPLLGYRRPHQGIDISASPGSPVVATARGRVTFAGRDAGYGRMVEVEHGFGYRTRYAHLARITTREGRVLERGDVIGEVGHSGLATGPNLHYEVWIDGRAVNPWEYILDRTPPY